MDKLRNVSGEGLEDYVINVHGLKGTSMNIGAEKVREAAFRLETLAKAGNLDEVLANNDQLIKDTENIIANILNWLEKNNP